MAAQEDCAMTTDVESIDTTIQQVERLYRTVTGQDAPQAGGEPMPPERSPEEHLGEQIDRLATALQTFQQESTGSVQPWAPPLTIWESATETVIALDLPGVPRKSARLSVATGVLEVTGERPVAPDGSEGPQLRYAEQVRGPFRRLVPLPPGTKPGDLRARMRDGVLEIRIARGVPSNDSVDVPIE
jgi:HSP20 family protein